VEQTCFYHIILWVSGWPVFEVIKEHRGSVREVTVQTLSPGGGLITKLKRAPDKLIPLEISNEIVISNADSEKRKEKVNVTKKYSREELAKFKKKKFWPPYKPSKQFLDPGSINVGPDQDYVNKDGSYKKIGLELTRKWK
jgi:hypothetical protein